MEMTNKYITQRERYEIELLLKQGYVVSEIAETLNRSRMTVYREIKRGTVELLSYDLIPYTQYCADYAQTKYDENKKNKGRTLAIGCNLTLLQYLENRIMNEKCSPYAALMMARADQVQGAFCICEKTVYNYVNQGVFLHMNRMHLPYCKPLKRKKKKLGNRYDARILTRRSIEVRSPDVLKRDKFGHWEMDLVVSGQEVSTSALLVLTERKERFELIYKIPDKTQKSVVRILNSIERKLGIRNFQNIFKTITTDNGSEFLDQKAIEKSVTSKKQNRTVQYFCHSYSSWERGSNENQNRMIRRFIKKGSDISQLSKKQVQYIQDWMNNYPRKKLKNMSAMQMLNPDVVQLLQRI